MTRTKLLLGSVIASVGALSTFGCGGTSFTSNGAGGTIGAAGSQATGGSSLGGSAMTGGGNSGGDSSGGTSSGGTSNGGTGNGGTGNGGTGNGGTGNGGTGNGGTGNGGTGNGGTGNGGTSAAGSSTGGSCTSAITFALVPGPSSKAGAFCEACGTVQFTVTDSNSAPVAIAQSCGAADCTSCTPSACPAVACFNQPLPAKGASRDWDGTQFVTNSCGAAAQSCQEPTCAPPGKYHVKMCAARNTSSAIGMTCTPGEQVCVGVDFVLPMAGRVVGTIGG